MRDGHGARAADAHGIDLVAVFGHVHEHAGFEYLVVEPFAEILLDDRREKFVVLAGADVGNAAFHGLFGIITGRNESHDAFPPA